MQTTNPTPVVQPQRGRGLIIAGAVLIAVSVVLGIAGFAIAAKIFDFASFQREVAFSGLSDRIVPGEIEFSVLDPLDDSDGSMTVGVALDYPDPTIQCVLSDEEGTPINLQRPAAGEELLDWNGTYTSFSVIGVARLEPGKYAVSCGEEGDATATARSFTVGRILSVDDVFGQFGPILWTMGAWGVAALLFIVGLVLLIVGLVQRARSKRDPFGGYPPVSYPQPPGSGPYGPGGYGQGGYGPTGYGPGPQAPAPPGQFGQPAPQPPAPQQPPGVGYPPPEPTTQVPAPVPMPQPTPPAPPAPPAPPEYGPNGPEYTPTGMPGVPPAGPDPDDGNSGWTVPPSKLR